MKNFTVFNVETRRILRSGVCMEKDFDRQAGPGEKVIEGKVNDVTHRMADGEDTVIEKTRQERDADNPPRPVVPPEKQAARITNEQWRDVLARLEKLETEG